VVYTEFELLFNIKKIKLKTKLLLGSQPSK